ncbi:hypothetical protein ACEWY4_020535 [Coilia grayii]|uniref:ribonuclease H n=1 Tax=Coilia grayii TaxID=363190 RepID=A0ABD1JD71_9TELE
MSLLRRTERRLSNNPEQVTIYNREINKLEKEGYAVKITSEDVNRTTGSWYIPHYMVFHNGKARVVFNCSFTYQEHNLNNNLLPGPTLGPPLLGVLLRFREHAVTISGDIRAMFHKVRLFSSDQPFLRFLWRDMEQDRQPDVYEWRVLPFGTTCSPCCATYAVRRHFKDHMNGNEDVMESVLTAFYVDNYLQSLPCPKQAASLIDKLRAILAKGGFDIRQWACNVPDVVAHLPSDARSEACELWLSADRTEPQESTLGLRWNCLSDVLGYKKRSVFATEVTMRTVYRILASQYDPLGFIIPYTTRAKVIVQALWRTERQWDDPIQDDLLPLWEAWESELTDLQNVTFPRRYTPFNITTEDVELHVFCDASEKAYGAVAYIRVVDSTGQTHVSFVLARSRVAPKCQLSIPRLELCAALTLEVPAFFCLPRRPT